MRRNLTTAFVVLFLVTLSSARPLAAQLPAGSDTLPTVLLPPDLDRVLRDYERAWRARDAGALAELFTEDGFVLSGGAPPVRGRANVEDKYARSGGPLHLRAIAFAAGDTVGYIIGTYGARPAEINAGKFILALRRRPGGRWQIAADMDNPSSAPILQGSSPATPGLDRQ